MAVSCEYFFNYFHESIPFDGRSRVSARHTRVRLSLTLDLITHHSWLCVFPVAPKSHGHSMKNKSLSSGETTHIYVPFSATITIKSSISRHKNGFIYVRLWQKAISTKKKHWNCGRGDEKVVAKLHRNGNKTTHEWRLQTICNRKNELTMGESERERLQKIIIISLCASNICWKTSRQATTHARLSSIPSHTNRQRHLHKTQFTRGCTTRHTRLWAKRFWLTQTSDSENEDNTHTQPQKERERK